MIFVFQLRLLVWDFGAYLIGISLSVWPGSAMIGLCILPNRSETVPVCMMYMYVHVHRYLAGAVISAGPGIYR